MEPYLGRKAVVRNLLNHLIMGRSAIVVGGPKMGKTTFLQQAAEAAGLGVKPVFIDLLKTRQPLLEQRLTKEEGPITLLLDRCEILLPDPTPFLNHIHQTDRGLGGTGPGIAWAGNLQWGEWAMEHRSSFGGPIRYYPLIALPPKEARLFLKSHLSDEVPSSELERFVDISGGHPYLLSRMLKPQDGYGSCDSFFETLWSAVESRDEQRVLVQLIEAGSWVLLQDLKNEAGGIPPKRVLDRLVVIGLIYRTLVDGSAAAKAVSPLLGNWARRSGRLSS